ncbi:MAG: transcriptional regulator [Candidatus Odinarchaeota archaeon]
MKTKYRSANIIIQTILEGILRVSYKKDYFHQGIVKSHLVQYCGLKTETAEKYLSKMEKAGYIESQIDHWGEKEIIIYNITSKGKERYEWFVKINAELENSL